MQEPIVYSNKHPTYKRLYVIAGFLAFLALDSIGFGLYLASIAGDWWIMFFFIFICISLHLFCIHIFSDGAKTIVQVPIERKWTLPTVDQ